MAWRLAHGLEKLRQQVNAKWPDRSKDSDGSIGDESHATRSSDHNPWVKDGAMGVVTAIDLTHDPAHGFNSYTFADLLLAKQDKRLKYVISNRRIGSGPAGPAPGIWRKYTGASPHDHHCHISIMSDKPHYDSTVDWQIDDVPTTIDQSFVPPPSTLRKGDKGVQVQSMQGRLNAHGARLIVKGEFDDVTAAALKAFQAAHGLAVDAICGPHTWKALNG